MDKLFWSIWESLVKKDTTTIRAKTIEMDTEQVQDNSDERCNEETVQYKITKPATILSLGEGVLF